MVYVIKFQTKEKNLTTIAYRDNWLVGDGVCSSGTSGVIMGFTKKIYKIEVSKTETLYWGGTGDADCEEIFTRFLLEGYYSPAKAKEVRGEWMSTKRDFSALVASSNGRITPYTSRLTVDGYQNEYYADGHGYEVALGALHAGADAVGAVQAGIAKTCYSDYPIQGFNIKTGEEVVFKDERAADKWRKELNEASK